MTRDDAERAALILKQIYEKPTELKDTIHENNSLPPVKNLSLAGRTHFKTVVRLICCHVPGGTVFG